MTPSRLIKVLAFSTSLLVTACATDSAGTDETDATDDGTVVHMMPLHNPDKGVSDAAPPGAHLTFFGGPTLTHVSVHPVFWNSNTQFQANISAFYKGITNSVLFDMLRQY